MKKKPATKQIKSPLKIAIAPDAYTVGETLLIRTATYHWVGTLVTVTPTELVLCPAVWVSDSGRLSSAMRDGLEKQLASELEPVEGNVTINRSGVIDAMRYTHKVPTAVK